MLASVALASSVAGWSAHAAPRLVGTPTVRRTRFRATHSGCDHPTGGALAYGWPVKPFRRQHPVRGNFGDPRTLSTEAQFGSDTPRSPGSFTFHNGIDISARTGTPVYPVVSGTARIGYSDEVIVTTGDFRTFQYFHVRPLVRTGQRVVAYRTVLGTVLPEWLHVHLTEIDGFRVHNPVDPGHLEPYQDHTVPAVDELRFSAENGTAVDPGKLRGRISVAADGRDTPPIPVPAEWFGFPVTPALVQWTLLDSAARVVVPLTTVADFRQTEPPNRDFWQVYAAGTYQNFPVFGHHYFFGRGGEYLFNLTPSSLDTTRFPDGDYVLTVRVADVCGNRGSLSEQVRIRNHGG